MGFFKTTIGRRHGHLQTQDPCMALEKEGSWTLPLLEGNAIRETLRWSTATSGMDSNLIYE